MSDAPHISIVIPCRNGGALLGECLKSINAQTYRRFEVLLVDDGSDDGTPALARSHGATVIENPRRGVAAARNHGAQCARGTWVVFADADVVWPPETLATFAAFVEKSPRDAVIGVQSRELKPRNFASVYKNHWMRYTYLRLHGVEGIALFYTTWAAIRRRAFLSAGGFHDRYRRPTIEDTVFGHRLKAKGSSAVVRREIEVEHRKAYTLGSLLRTDRQRSRDLAAFTWRRGLGALVRGNQTSVPTTSLASVAVSLLMLALLPLEMLLPPVGLLVGGLLMLLFLLLNRGFLGHLRREEGLWFAARGALFLLIDIWWIDVGIAQGVLLGDGLRPKWRDTAL